MAVSLKHLFESGKSNGPDGTRVQPSNWNEEHVLTQATNRLLGRSTAGAGATEEITPGTALQLSGGDLNVVLDTDGTMAANSATVVASQSAVKTYADTKIPSSYLDTDGTLAANSDTKVATQKAVKTYADSLVAANDAMVFKGAQDCSSNPNYPAANRGDTYRVSVAGKIGGGSGPNVEAGDLLICNTDSSSSGNHASVGANWNIIQVNIDGVVVGPASVTDDRIAIFDGTTGKLIADGGYTISDIAANATNIAATIHAASSKATPVDDDELGVIDSAASNVLKKLTWANLKATLIAAFKAAAAAFWAGSNDATFLTPKTIADAGALVSQTSGTTINTDGSAGQNFMVTLDHNATFAAPTNLIDGKVYTWIIKQGSTGGTGAFNAVFVFPSTPTLSTGAGKYDIVSAVYCAADSKLIARFSKGS